MPEIFPAIMPRSLAELRRESEQIHTFAQAVHIDVMDGNFVSAISWPYHTGEHEELLTHTHLPVPRLLMCEVHLMVAHPRDIGIAFITRGVSRVIGHIETMGHPNDALQMIRDWRTAGAREVGIALLLDTDLNEIAGCISEVDVVQVMSIARIGYQGEPFDTRVIARIRELRATYPHLCIAVDGGVSQEVIPSLYEAGVNRFAVGSAIIQSTNPQDTYRAMLHMLG